MENTLNSQVYLERNTPNELNVDIKQHLETTENQEFWEFLKWIKSYTETQIEDIVNEDFPNCKTENISKISHRFLPSLPNTPNRYRKFHAEVKAIPIENFITMSSNIEWYNNGETEWKHFFIALNQTWVIKNSEIQEFLNDNKTSRGIYFKVTIERYRENFSGYAYSVLISPPLKVWKDSYHLPTDDIFEEKTVWYDEFSFLQDDGQTFNNTNHWWY